MDLDYEDWAEDQDFFPENNNYLKLLDTGLDWEDFLEVAMAAVKKHIEEKADDPTDFLTRADAVAMGYDEGDLYRIK